MTEDEVKDIIKLNLKTPKWVEVAREQHDTLSALIDGKDFKDELSKIEHIEKSEKRWKVREKYSRSIKDLNQRLLRPLDNVYAATGGAKHYNLPESQKKELLSKLAKVRGNQSLERWLKINWMHVYHTDPNGVIFIEYKDDNCWTTYKSINNIRNYLKDGQNLEWLLFEPKKAITNNEPVEYVRFVDNETDWTFKKTGDTITLDEDKTFNHPFGKVPGIVNSDINKMGFDYALSPIDRIIEAQQEYLRDQSQKTLYKFLLWNPIFWRYRSKCPSCNGTGKNGNESCSQCSGTGWKLDRDITDEVLIPPPEDNDTPKLAPDIAGWIAPPDTILNQFTNELKVIEIGIYETQWGSHKSETSSGSKTQLEIWADEQPVMNRLNDYGDVAEWTEHELTELIANFLFPAKDKSEQISSIQYGRNYIIQPPEFLLEKYHSNKTAGDGVVVLDKNLSEYLTAKYKNDPISLRIMLLKKRLEYNVHYTYDQVEKIFGLEQSQRKMLFVDWWETLTQEDFNKPIGILEKERDEFTQNKLTNNKKDE
jgi:hypothetical protein